MTALLDTDSEKCIINYKNVTCLPNDCIKEFDIVVRGVNSSNSVIGEVTLELQINKENTISTNALNLKDANFSHDLILGRDLLAVCQIDLKQKTITSNDEQICFLEKRKNHIVRENKVKDTSCLLNEIVNVIHRKKKCKFKVEAFSVEKVRDKFQLFRKFLKVQ